MLDEKDILVCVDTRNILWGWGCFRYVKVPSSPYKRGREGTCKRIQSFWNLCNQQRELQSLRILTVCLNVLRILSLTRVWEVIRIFWVTPQQWWLSHFHYAHSWHSFRDIMQHLNLAFVITMALWFSRNAESWVLVIVPTWVITTTMWSSLPSLIWCYVIKADVAVY
jgi:hypothetical protein